LNIKHFSRMKLCNILSSSGEISQIRARIPVRGFYATFRRLVVRALREILLLTAPKIAARLSMLGLPLGESMRCKLLLIVGRWRDPNETFHGYARTP
jgi:hypothetical protein